MSDDKILSGPPLKGPDLLTRLERRMGSMKLIGERDDLLLDAALYVQRTEDMAEALKASKIEHHIGDDSWESCHKTDDWYECHGKIRGTPRVCNCGADEHNARINAALAKAGVE